MSWLTPRKRGKVIIAYEYRWNEKGLTRSKSTGTNNLAQAQKIKKKWDAITLIYGAGAFSEDKSLDLSIENQLNLFLEDKAAEIRPSTVKRYKQQMRRVFEFLNKHKIKRFDQLNSSVMKLYKIERTNAGAAPKTIFEELALLRAAIRTLVEEEMLDADPVRSWPKIKKIPVKPETLGCYTEEEIGRLLDYFEENDTDFYEVFLFAVYSGCRYGEIKALRVSDVDLGNNLIYVKNEKTASNRLNAISAIRLTANVMKMIVRKTSGALPSAWLFPQIRLHSHMWTRRRMIKACKALNIQYRRFHGTRHSYISAGLNAGIPAPYIQHQARHSRLSTTDNYAHNKLIPSELAELVNFPRKLRKCGGGGQ